MRHKKQYKTSFLVMIRRVATIILFTATLGAEQTYSSPIERWGCADSSGSGDIYYLDIHEDSAIYDYRRLAQNTKYDILVNTNLTLIAAVKVTPTPDGKNNPDTCFHCLENKFLILDRNKKQLIQTGLYIGRFNNQEANIEASEVKNKCDLLN